MAVDKNRAAKDRIINALGDLYRVERHSPGISDERKRAVQQSINGLEAEYKALLGLHPETGYSVVTQAFSQAKSNLEKVRDERKEIANAFVSATKLLGSLTPVIRLITG